MKRIKCIALLCLWIPAGLLLSQGPPITGDGPILLGAHATILRSSTELYILKEKNFFFKSELQANYLPTSNTLLAVHLPIVFTPNYMGMGDAQVVGKYQFYRKDKTGHTSRMVFKSLQTLPTTLKQLEVEAIVTNKYQSYQSVIWGIEDIRYGLSNELGYNLVIGDLQDELVYKLGVGLPLLEPTYPVRQINLFFETKTSWFTQLDGFQALYAQGIQYAKGRWTLESAYQFRVVKNPKAPPNVQTVYLSGRYIF